MSRLLRLVPSIAALSCSGPGVADRGLDAAPVSDAGADAPRSTFCDGVQADICDDFERGGVSARWHGVEATGGVLGVVAGGHNSAFALSADKTSVTGAAHIMTKAIAESVTGLTASYFVRVVRAPADPAQGAFVSSVAVAGSAGFGIAVFAQAGGGMNAELYPLMGARVRLGVIAKDVWVRVNVEVICTTGCVARAQLDDAEWQQVSLTKDPMGENAAQFGVNVGAAGGDWSVQFDDVVLRWKK